MPEPIREHEWIAAPQWRWCQNCGVLQRRVGLDDEWAPPVDLACLGGPAKDFVGLPTQAPLQNARSHAWYLKPA